MNTDTPGADEAPDVFGADYLTASAALHRCDASGLAWLSVHGALLLALRHPQVEGVPRAVVMEFVTGLGEALVAWGILTPEGVAKAGAGEAEESPHGD